MKNAKPVLNAILVILLCAGATAAALAQAPPAQEPSSEKEIKEALTGGVPLGRWNEGLLFEGIAPQPWLVSAANWFPRTEDVQPNEMRIIFMGTSPMVLPEWPVDGDLVIPLDQAPDDPREGMGEAWKVRERNR